MRPCQTEFADEILAKYNANRIISRARETKMILTLINFKIKCPMKYYLCIVGSFQDGTENVIIEDCINRNIYQYHESTRQKGAGASIQNNDTLILVYKKEILAYGVADGEIGTAKGKDDSWMALPIRGKWILSSPHIPLPYGVYWHILSGNKQSVVKEIDALWANDLILRITLNNDRKKLPTEPVIPLHLPTIATFFMKGLLTIPSVQRGKVWNAVRAEVLWDSLLRNIPIGTLSIRPVKDPTNGNCHWDLLDGQQRTNAIMLGYQDFPSMKSSLEQKEKSILWLDLGMYEEDTEQNDGTKKRSERKFFFKVTTLAQPWGYKLSDNEIQNSYLKAYEKHDSVEHIEANWERHDKKGQRPYPYEIWPVDAKFPVPFTALRSFCEQNAEPDFEHFWFFCQKEYQDRNWIKFHQLPSSLSFAPEYWKTLISAIKKLNSIIILAQNSTAIADCDIGLYFKRMNKAGIEPDNEEIRYSLLKAKLPDLKKIDKIAAGRMRSAQLANIVMLSYCTKKENKWKRSISFSDIGVLAQDNGFKKYVGDEFESVLTKIESWLLYDKEWFPEGLPQVLYSTIPHANIDLYRLLIFFSDRDSFIEQYGRKNLVALVSSIAWFGNSNMVVDGYNKCQKAEPNNWVQAVKLWLFDSIKNNSLTIPPPPDVYEKILKASESKEMEAVGAEWSNPGYREGIERTWHWTKNAGRSLLLYSLRRYLQDNFQDYDAVDAVWSEENRPWDYDHIFPQDWLQSGRGNSHGTHHELVSGFLNSIGNIAPISFSRNRGKGAKAPGKYQGETDNRQLYVEYSSFFDEQYGSRLENDPALAFQFAQITAKRLYRLYQEWYSTLDISNLFDFSVIEDSRRILFEKMRNGHPECQIYFPVANGLQIEWHRPTDWARAWLACGMMRKVTINNTQHPCFVCIASDGAQYEIGIRRYPKETLIDGKSDWWFPGFCEVVHSANPNLNELICKFEKAIENNKERLEEL